MPEPPLAGRGRRHGEMPLPHRSTAPPGGRLWHGFAVRRPPVGRGGEGPDLRSLAGRDVGSHPMQTRLSLDIGGMRAKCLASRLLHRAHPRRLPRGLRPHDPQLDQARRAAQLQARRLAPDRPRRRRGLPRPATGTRRHETRESPIKRRNPSGEIVWVARYTGRDGKRRIAKPTWNRGKGTFDRKARSPAGDRRGLRALGSARHPRRVLRHLDRAPPAIGAHQRDQRAPDQPRRSTWRSRASR